VFRLDSPLPWRIGLYTNAVAVVFACPLAPASGERVRERGERFTTLDHFILL